MLDETARRRGSCFRGADELLAIGRAPLVKAIRADFTGRRTPRQVRASSIPTIGLTRVACGAKEK
jgi:hypothetical protein